MPWFVFEMLGEHFDLTCREGRREPKHVLETRSDPDRSTHLQTLLRPSRGADPHVGCPRVRLCALRDWLAEPQSYHLQHCPRWRPLGPRHQ